MQEGRFFGCAGRDIRGRFGGARLGSFFAATMLAATLSGEISAQEGAIAGRVTDATTLVPVPSARISVVGEGAPAEVISRRDGSFELRLGAGVYDLLVEVADFAPTRFDRVRVTAGQTTTKNLPLESQGYRLAGFIVTASRGSVDTEITAPSSSHSVRDLEIKERPATSLVEHLRESPAVDIGTQGVQASNVVVRGFNNIFSGALHMLTDYRLAGLPALRANLMHFLPSIEDDIERMEIVLGPGSALYGPDTANGVLHLITRSPLESPGNTVTLAVGERSVFQGAFRSAFLVNEDFGVKISGQLFSAEEWPYVDATEASAKEGAATEEGFAMCVIDREARGLTTSEAELACTRIGNRDFRIRRYGVEARADWRYSDRGTLVGTFGATDMSGIELTGLSAVQIKNWLYQYVQARLTYDRWAVQTYFNITDSGDFFFIRDGVPLEDRSTLGVVQVQNGFSLLEGRQDFTYGWDYFSTRPESRGTIYGDFEGDNDVTEWGIYLHSKTALSPKLDLIAAGRIDSHSILPDYVFSPRVALVVKPNEHHAIRFAYNRAFSTPTALNYFLDIGAGFPKGFGDFGYSSRAFGSGRNGFAWQNADGSLRGMRSPFNTAGSGELLPIVDQPALWELGLVAADRLSESGLPDDVRRVLEGLAPPGASDVDIMFLDTNELTEDVDDPRDVLRYLRPVAELNLPDVAPIRETNTESLEVGWSGVFSNAVRVSLDVYYKKQNDFVSPLVVETPLLYLDATDLGAWLGAEYVPARVEDLLDVGLTEEEARAQATTEAEALAGGIGVVPLAVATSDVAEMASGGADLIATYRNLGDIDLWGADAALQWFLSPEWTLSGTYSHVSENWFRIDGDAALALNAPADKGTLGIAYRNEALGLSASARARHTGSFPFESTDFVGTNCIPDAPSDEECIDAYTLFDVTMGYKIRRTAATVELSISNLANTPYRSFVGVPAVGRLAMVRVRYDF